MMVCTSTLAMVKLIVKINSNNIPNMDKRASLYFLLIIPLLPINIRKQLINQLKTNSGSKCIFPSDLSIARGVFSSKNEP